MATPLADLTPGTQLTVCGWVRSSRLARKDTLLFIDLNDGSATVPCVAADPLDLKAMAPVGTGLILRGKLAPAPAKATQSHEFVVSDVDWIGACPTDGYPITKPGRDAMALEGLRAVPHLRLRDPRLARAQRIRSALTLATHRFFQERRFLQAHTPILTASDCEGAGEMFQIADKGFFGGAPAYLTVSGQLEGEQMAIGGGLGRVYTFGPTFRAEESHTTRHLAEFWMIEPEWVCAHGLRELVAMAEAYVRACARALATEAPAELVAVLDQPFGWMTYTEAIEKLQAFGNDVKWGDDLSSDQEQWLCARGGRRPIVVTGYPRAIKAFYMRVADDDPRTVEAMDVLVPGIGELIGGSVREERLDVLLERMAECGLDAGAYQAYVDTRRFGSMPHCGFGLGFERLVRLLSGLENIRDVIPFPRVAGRAPV